MPALFEAYVTNLGKYNECELVGEYLKFPTTPEEVQALLKRIGVDGVRYEEIFITDFNGDVLGLYDHLGEYENLDELNHLACLLSELDQSDLEKFEAADVDVEYEIEGEDLATPQEIYKQAQLFAEARGKQLLPEEVVFAQDQDDNQDQNTPSTIATISVPASAVEVTEGKGSSQTLTAKGEKWFTFTTPSGGAYNIYTTGSVNTYGELYKKGILGLSLVTESGNGGSGNNFRIETDLKNNTTYYVRVSGGTTSASGSFRFYFAGNRDSKSSAKGGEWRWSTMDVDPDGAFFNVDQITYLNSTQAAGYYSVVATDNIRKVRDAVINLSTTKALEWLMNYYGVNVDVAKWILDALAIGSAVVPQIPSLTSMELDSIAEAAGRNPDTGVCSRGLVIYSVTTYTSTGSGGVMPVPMNTYDSWSGSMMYGEKYYRGEFETPTNPIPLWR